MRTIFVESRTSTLISAPASLVNTRLFPEMDLIVPSADGALAVPGLICAGSCAGAASIATEPRLHAPIPVVTAITHKPMSPAYRTGFRKMFCSGNFMSLSSIVYFRVKAHLYLCRLDVSFGQNRFTLSPRSHKECCRYSDIPYLRLIRDFFE